VGAGRVRRTPRLSWAVVPGPRGVERSLMVADSLADEGTHAGLHGR